MANSPVSSLILPLNYIKMSFYFKYQVKSSSHFVIKSIWNFKVSHIFRFSRWLLLPPGHCTTSRMKSLAFSFSERERDVFARLWCHYKGISSKIGESSENRDFSWFRLVKCIPITKLNVTIPVLFKTLIKASPHPFSHHPPHPITPPPLPHPSCPHPLAPFCNPFPQQFGPPCQK